MSLSPSEKPESLPGFSLPNRVFRRVPVPGYCLQHHVLTVGLSRALLGSWAKCPDVRSWIRDQPCSAEKVDTASSTPWPLTLSAGQ